MICRYVYSCMDLVLFFWVLLMSFSSVLAVYWLYQIIRDIKLLFLPYLFLQMMNRSNKNYMRHKYFRTILLSSTKSGPFLSKHIRQVQLESSDLHLLYFSIFMLQFSFDYVQDKIIALQPYDIFILLCFPVMQSKSKKRVEQISFILQNIFIIHPNPNSKYKIRLIVNRNDSNNSFRKVSNRYIFKINNDLAQLKQKACYLVLLQKTKKEGQNNDYLEIGKGQINLSQIIEDQQIKNESTINGAVYGTRSYNYDRIIGKYSYQVSKVEGNSSQNRYRKIQPATKPPAKLSPTLSQSPSKPIVIKSKRKQKSPFIFQQSIQQQQRDLQSKIKELAQSMNKIMSAKQIEEPYQYQQRFLSNKLLPIKESLLDQNEYYYKYNDKFTQHLNDLSSNPKQYTILTIKNIRVDDRAKQSQGGQMLETIKVQKPKAQLSKKNNCKKVEEVLLVFYQLFEERKVRKRLLQIYVPLYLNKQNRNLVHQIFYLPKTNNKILIEIIFITDPLKKQKNLNGVIPPSVAKSRLIQLFDTDNQEKGIFICQIENCTEIDREQAKAYKKQTSTFDKLLRKYGNASQFVKKIKQPQIKEQVPLKEPKTLDNNLKDTLYSNFHDNKDVKKIQRKRYTTTLDEQSGKLEVITSSISRHNKSLTTSNHNLSLSQKNSTRFFSKSIRAFPSMLQSVVGKGNKEGYLSSQDTKYRLYIQSIQCYIYQMHDKGTKFLLKLNLNGKNQSKKIVLTQQDWHPLNIQFKQFAIKQSLSGQLLVNKRNTTVYKKVGKYNIMMSEMQDSKNKYKAFIYHQNKDVGYVVFKFKMFKKEADQKSQSFYYQQGFQRHSLVRSEDANQGQHSQYQDLGQSIIIHSETDRSFDKIDYRKDDKPIDISSISKQIEPGQSTNEHYITQRASEGRASELLENEDYQNGETIHRRF